MFGAVAAISFFVAICFSLSKAVLVSATSGIGECFMPDESQLEFGSTKTYGSLAYACLPKPVQIGSFDGLSGWDLKDAVKEAISKFEHHEDQKLTKQNRSRKSHFGSKKAKCVLPTGSKLEYAQYKTVKNVLYRCELFAVAIGCTDRSREKPRAPGDTWNVFSEQENNEIGYIESCRGRNSEYQIQMDGCFYKDTTMNVGCSIKFHEEDHYANLYCSNTASGRYELVEKIPKKKLGRKYLEVICTENGPETVDCEDNNRKPKTDGQIWIEPDSKLEKPEMGLVRSCQRSGDMFEVVTENCYFDGRLLAIGCYYKLKDWSYVSCEIQKHTAKVSRFHTLLHTILVKDCGSFEESTANLPQYI